MTKDKRFYLFWFAFLLTPAFIAFVNASVVNPPFLQQNPTVTVPPQTVGTTDSLQIATQLFKTNKHKEALKISLALLQKATQSKDSFQIEKISYLIANIFKNTNNYDKALEYFNKTLLIAQNSSNLVYISTLQLDIGVMYTKINNLNSASYYYKKIINLNENNNQIKQLQARAYANLSGVYFFQGNLVQAESYALEALYLQKDFKNHLAIAHAQNNLASIYLEQNRFRDAKRELFEALSLIENNKTREGFDYKETINDNLSWALYNLKDYRAYEYHEKSTLIRDSLRNAEIGAFLAEIEGKYNEETIKKREELKTAEEKTKRIQAQRDNLRTEGINNILIIISLSLLLAAWLIYRYLKLRQSNLSLELKQNQLIQQNKLEQLQNDAREKILNATIDGKESERKMIAETLHNSVSTLLSSASLHLQASKMLLKDNLPEEIEKAQRIVNEAAEKIRNLSHSLVSSVLLKFGLNYATQDLCDKYSNAALNFHCKCDGINRYESQFELKINSIIDELLNNIIKHSKASNAEIRLKEKKEKLIIAILDDGKGFDTRNGLVDKGLGLAQIEARIRKMQGEFKITSSPNEGTSVYISVPVKRVENKLLVSK